MPTQYFSGKTGLANGIIKLGGGLGSTVLSITLELLIRRLGIPWMFRALGLLTLTTGLPAACFIEERSPPGNAAFIDLSIFRNLPSVAIFLASAIGTLTLFIPPYFTPLFARSAGLSFKTGAGLVAGFNAAASAGRFGGGPVCDWMGPLNTFFIAMALNAISVLAIWTISSSIVVRLTVAPTVVASRVAPGLAAVAMSMNVTGWTAGYLLGTLVASYLLEATGADKAKSVGPYRPAILYAGVIAFVSSAFVLLARLKLDLKKARRI